MYLSAPEWKALRDRTVIHNLQNYTSFLVILFFTTNQNT